MPPSLLLPLSMHGRGNFVGCLCDLTPRALKLCAQTFKGFFEPVEELLFDTGDLLRELGQELSREGYEP